MNTSSYLEWVLILYMVVASDFFFNLTFEKKFITPILGIRLSFGKKSIYLCNYLNNQVKEHFDHTKKFSVPLSSLFLPYFNLRQKPTYFWQYRLVLPSTVLYKSQYTVYMVLFLLLSNILIYKHNTICLSILLLMEIWVISNFGFYE